jgi:hypothetical protein
MRSECDKEGNDDALVDVPPVTLLDTLATLSRRVLAK